VDSEAVFIANRDRLFRYFVRAVGEAAGYVEPEPADAAH
jgi:hypothetical protein